MSQKRGIRCVVDYLTTVSRVAGARVGLLGICAGGGYAIKAAQTERRLKARGTIVANDVGEAMRRWLPTTANPYRDGGGADGVDARHVPRRALDIR
ncbi:hypothetical protein ATY76_29300 [Rhizobium sp. R339]|uniref:hypothetical protein n=1 Tax=Rhizobium sp. R339 TaxID=1764273 RepID=UPI000B537DD4|nr:hypothetical protein [Rhizobium sp. R339]OWV73752.1 hypothetical protein ATY76_29300 [Rhizobium sp. R339]